MNWSTVWSRDRAEMASDLFPPHPVEESPFEYLTKVCCKALADSHPTVSLELVGTTKQETYITWSDMETAVIFDLCQSMVLKQLCSRISFGADYLTIAKSLKECMALYVSTHSYSLAKKLHRFDLTGAADHRFSRADLAESEDYLKPFRGVLSTPFFQRMIDTFLIAHELYHLKVSRGTDDGLMQRASNAFDSVLDVVCYEDLPDEEFRRQASYGGKVDIDKEGLAVGRRELADRRRYYNENKNRILEEIACDMFAYECVLAELLGGMDGVDKTHFLRMFEMFYILFCVVDLHKAMNNRAVMSFELGIDAEKPSGIADIHLRKVALIYAAAANFMDNLEDEAAQTNSTFRQVSEALVHIQSPLKLALDALYVVPVTNAITRMLREVEQSSIRSHDPYLGNDHAEFFDPLVLGSEELIEDSLGPELATRTFEVLFGNRR